MAKLEIEGVKGLPFANLNHYEATSLYETEIFPKLKEINANSGYKIWGYRSLSLELETAFTGSFGAVLSWRVDEALVRDIDVMIPVEAEEHLKRTLLSMGIPCKKHGTQIACMLTIKGEPRQFDFELKPFRDFEPCEWALLSNSWDLRDADIGLKGAYHKMLLMSLTAAWDEIDCLSLAYGLRTRALGTRDYTTNMEDIVLRLFDLQKKHDPVKLCAEALEEEKMYHLAGVLELMKNYLDPYQIQYKVLKKLNTKMGEREFDKEQIDLVVEKVKEVLGIDMATDLVV